MARDKVRNEAEAKKCRFLSLSALRCLDWGRGLQLQSAGTENGKRRRRLQLEMALDKLAEFFAVFIAHMYEFDAAAVGADVADYGGETDLPETGAHLELDGIADSESSRGLQIS